MATVSEDQCRAYCLACRLTVKLNNPVVERTKLGKYVVIGNCPHCDQRKSRLVSVTSPEGETP